MIFICAIIISQWSTKEQNKGHWFCISWSLWNPLFPSLWARPAGLLQETLQTNTKTWQSRLTHLPPFFPQDPKLCSSKSETFPALNKAQCWSSSREEACFPLFVKQDIHKNGPVNFCVAKPTSHEQSRWFYLRILHFHRRKNQPHLRFPAFQHGGGQARDPWRPLQIS